MRSFSAFPTLNIFPRKASICMKKLLIKFVRECQLAPVLESGVECAETLPQDGSYPNSFWLVYG